LRQFGRTVRLHGKVESRNVMCTQAQSLAF
jgi:hypothetical protein